MPGRAGPRAGLHPSGQLHVVGRHHALPLHVRPGGGLLGPLLVRRRGRGWRRRGPLRHSLVGAARLVRGGALPLPLPTSPRVPPGRACVRLLRGPTQGSELRGRTGNPLGGDSGKHKLNASTGKGKDGETPHRGLLPWIFFFGEVSLQIPDTEISQIRKKKLGAFSEQPGKISSPSWQTVLSALHVAISCSISNERADFFQGAFFYSQPIRHVSLMQVLYIVVFVHQLCVKELELFLCCILFSLPCFCGHFVLFSIPISGLLS